MKRVSKATQVAQKNIDELYAVAQRELSLHPEDSRTAIRHLRRMAQKHTIVITDLKRTFCLGCNTLLVPGKTATVRVRNGRQVVSCTHCGRVKRLGLSEQ